MKTEITFGGGFMAEIIDMEHVESIEPLIELEKFSGELEFTCHYDPPSAESFMPFPSHADLTMPSGEVVPIMVHSVNAETGEITYSLVAK